jgi:hypothetical protein
MEHESGKHDGMKGMSVRVQLDRRNLFEQVAAHIEREIVEGMSQARRQVARPNGTCRAVSGSANQQSGRP